MASMPPDRPISDGFFQRADECTVEIWLAFLGHRWNALILYHLSLRPMRFGGLQTCLPSVTPKVLADRLSDLGGAGIVHAPVKRGGQYRLSEARSRLMPILFGLEGWSREMSNPTRLY